MATLCIKPADDIDPDIEIRCPRCAWKGVVAQARVIRNASVMCPKCTGPCVQGHLPKKLERKAAEKAAEKAEKATEKAT